MRLCHRDLYFVGVTGFEPATTWSQTRCATGLRYAPKASEPVLCSQCDDKGSQYFVCMQMKISLPLQVADVSICLSV